MIKNRSKYFNLNTLHRISLGVPCGHCAECLQAKQNEYYFRSYYQAMECWSKGGYCLFDTLTYNDDNVPHINDFLPEELELEDDKNFTCFNYEDIRYFLVRLRRSLGYHGFNCKDNLRYFICSEYGEDPRYTHRPHYHVMFYVTDSSLDPITLSTYINKSWQKGITDGADYKGASYVLQNRVFYKGADDLHMQSVCHYIGKYMTKDSEFTKIVNLRVKEVEETLTHMEYYHFFDNDVRCKQFLKGLKRHIVQFTRQSQGFGEYMIDCIGKDWIFEHNAVRMPDKEHVWKEIPIPAYIMCKLFKEKKVDADGTIYYGWSDYGNEFRQYHSLQADKQLADNIVDLFSYDNLTQWFPDRKIFGYDEIDAEGYAVHKKGIYEILNENMAGRSVDDFVFYQKYMKGRIYVPESVEEPDFESYYYVDQRQCVSDSSISREELFSSNNDDVIWLIDNYVYKDKKFDNVIRLMNYVKSCRAKYKQALWNEKNRQEAVWKSKGLKFKR